MIAILISSADSGISIEVQVVCLRTDSKKRGREVNEVNQTRTETVVD